jgi:hypothetical protein
MAKEKSLNLYERFLWRNLFKLMERMGFIYSDFKTDKDDMIEAITFSKNSEYIDKVGEIE